MDFALLKGIVFKDNGVPIIWANVEPRYVRADPGGIARSVG